MILLLLQSGFAYNLMSCNDEKRNRLSAVHDFKLAPEFMFWTRNDVNGNCFGLLSVWSLCLFVVYVIFWIFFKIQNEFLFGI